MWEERHYLGAAFAGIGLLTTGLLAFRLAGTATGLLAVALLALSPKYVGHAANNPKDIPFAALCILSLLAFAAVRPAPPFLSWRRAVMVGLALALPLNVRPGGLLYLAYFGGLLARPAKQIQTSMKSECGCGPSRMSPSGEAAGDCFVSTTPVVSLASSARKQSAHNGA